MDNVIVNQREATIMQMLHEIEAEMKRLQQLIDESQAYLDACQQQRRVTG